MENIQSKLVTAFQKIWVFIDRLPQKFVEHPILAACLLMGLSLFITIKFLKMTHLNQSFATWIGLVEKKDLVDESIEEKNHSRSKFLVRESARLVASALEKRSTNVLEAYENAAQASVLARTAKEMDTDVSKLSDDLGVDFYEYLSYTGTVLQELRSNVWR